MTITYQALTIGNADVFYREAGRSDAPVIPLLHGSPTAGHMFRDLIPILADSYRVIAPDLPGFGNTKAPPLGRFDFTFDALAQVIAGFIEALNLTATDVTFLTTERRLVFGSHRRIPSG